MNLSPLSKRRVENFRLNRRGFYSAIIFVFLFITTIFAEFIANDKPIFVVFDNKFYFPVVEKIPETFFGGEFETESDYKDPLKGCNKIYFCWRQVILRENKLLWNQAKNLWMD